MIRIETILSCHRNHCFTSPPFTPFTRAQSIHVHMGYIEMLLPPNVLDQNDHVVIGPHFRVDHAKLHASNPNPKISLSSYDLIIALHPPTYPIQSLDLYTTLRGLCTG